MRRLFLTKLAPKHGGRTLLLASLMLFALFSACMPTVEAWTKAELCDSGSTYAPGRVYCAGYFTDTNFFDAKDGVVHSWNTIDPDVARPWDPHYPADIGNAFANVGTFGDTNPAATFERDIKGYLDYGSPSHYDYNSAGAAFLIDIMLGAKPTDLCSSGKCTWADGVRYAQNPTHYNDWVNKVNAYDAAGAVTWSMPYTIPAGTIDSTHACLRGYSHAIYCGGTESSHPFDSEDLVMRKEPAASGANSIVFWDPAHIGVLSAAQVRINRVCANMFGNVIPLKSGVTPRYGLTPHVTTTSSNVDPGGSATFKYSVDNSGPNISPSDTACQAVATTYGPPPHVPDGAISGGKRTGGGATDVGDVRCSGSLAIGTTSLGTVTISIPPGAIPGSAYCRSLEVAPMDDSHTDITLDADWRTSAEACVVVAAQPYISVQGGDASAGNAVSSNGGSCDVTPSTNAGFASWNTEASAYNGAGTQYAAFALGYIQDFVSAQGSGSQPIGLSFANNRDGRVNIGGGLFGGNFGTENCIPNYFADIPSGVTVNAGNFTLPGSLGVSGSISNGTHQIIYVNGNVYINSNITFSGSYANISDIPSFYLVVSGNIYIAPNVTEIDGVYIAQPTTSTSSDGIIYTCAPSPFTNQPLTSSLYSNCSSNTLTVNGSLTARQVWFERAAGTLSNNTPAETIDESPDIWLAIPPDISTGGVGAGNTYDAITSLPPIL